jgi:hypothetical protein
MLSKCANPGCTATFLYLHQGKLFRLNVDNDIPVSSALPNKAKSPPRVEFFWLYSDCATELTVDYNRGTGVEVVPLPKPLAHAAVASQV